MKKRILASQVCLCLLLGLIPSTAFATGAAAEATPVFEISGTNISAVNGQYSSVSEGAKAYYENAYGEAYTMTLLADTSINISPEDSLIEGIPVGIIITGAGSILDLNGHTLTVTGNGIEIEGYSLPGMAISTSAASGAITVKNGKIVLDGTNLAGIVNGDNGLTVEDIEILSGNNASNLIGIWNGLEEGSKLANTVIKNCQVVLGQDNIDLKGTAYSESTYKIWVQSGSFTSNPVTESQTSIAYAENSAVLSSSLDGVTGVVITSPSTTAIIVQNGKAYTYDTLQAAVYAADGKTEILLVKQPEEEKVKVPNSENLTIKPLEGKNNIDISKVPVVDKDGNKLEITENGELEPVVVPAESITLNQSSVTLYSNATPNTVQLTATVQPDDATDKTVTWTSSDPAVAAVDNNGLVAAVSNGTATITASAGDKTATCAVTVTTYTTGGDSYEPSTPVGDYLVSVDKTIGGKVTVNPGRADKGDTVTITVRPDKGYELDELTVTAKNGDTVKLTEKSGNKFTFKMPGSKVTVEAVFVKENGEKPVVTLPFADVTTGDWFYDAVAYVYGNDLMNGTSATAFSPYLTTSRAMMLTMLARYDGVDTTTGSTWYEAGAVWAVAEGISDGTNLEADLTREQLVTMLWRYTGSPVVESDLSAYPDGGAVSDWAVNAMIWATQTGVITGNGAGALAPQGTATRAEVATILARFCAGK